METLDSHPSMHRIMLEGYIESERIGARLLAIKTIVDERRTRINRIRRGFGLAPRPLVRDLLGVEWPRK